MTRQNNPIHRDFGGMTMQDRRDFMKMTGAVALGAALGRVNYYEIAEMLIDEVIEDGAGN